MEYESNILKRLIDTYGVVGNPRYISEIIKEFIVRGKECYPNLFTYQADWLAHIDEFGLKPTYTVSYTGQSIYAPNTLERPVKSAILKGSTKYRDIDTGEFLETFEEGRNLELVSVKMPVLTTTGKNLFDNTSYIEVSDNQFPSEIVFENGGFCYTYTNKPTTWKSVWYDLKLKPNTKYTINYNSNLIDIFIFKSQVETYVGSEYIASQYIKDKDVNIIQNVKLTFTTSDVGFVRIRLTNQATPGDAIINNIQLEEGSIATPYEPFKSNILTVNEDVTLRSNGSVCDELDLLTGKLTQRIDEDGGVLTQEVVKTVDLTIHDKDHQKVERLTSFEGGTHFTTSSQDGSLLPTIAVDVVTDLEKTLMVCSLEGNTM